MVRRGGLVANSAGPRSVGPYAPEMADPMTQLPADAVESGAERPMLEWFLSYYRAVLARKLEGVSEAGARRMACPPSDLSLIGLVRHMAEVERVWASRNFGPATDRAERQPSGCISWKAPCWGSWMTQLVPTPGIANGSCMMAPPLACTVAIAASMSATVKYTAQWLGTSSGT